MLVAMMLGDNGQDTIGDNCHRLISVAVTLHKGMLIIDYLDHLAPTASGVG